MIVRCINFGDKAICAEFTGADGLPAILLKALREKMDGNGSDEDREKRDSAIPLVGLRFKNKKSVEIVISWLQELCDNWEEIQKEAEAIKEELHDK